MHGQKSIPKQTSAERTVWFIVSSIAMSTFSTEQNIAVSKPASRPRSTNLPLSTLQLDIVNKARGITVDCTALTEHSTQETAAG